MSLEKAIACEVRVAASVDEVWRAWTTEEGVRSFFAPDARIDLRPGGAYEILFDLEQPEGLQGGEGMQILALQEPEMLSFTWNAPPHLPAARAQRTSVVVRLHPENDATRVTLHHGGWGEGGEWDAAFEYFQIAWGRVVLPRLRHRFEQGPIDWSHPPELAT